MIGILSYSDKPNKKYNVELFETASEHPFVKKIANIDFGANGYEDFTTHKDCDRKARYLKRHKNENWDDPTTPAFWATNLLWNKPTIKESANDITKHYGIKLLVSL